jgi:RNA polymerase sigma factor (sigma-70 family)
MGSSGRFDWPDDWAEAIPAVSAAVRRLCFGWSIQAQDAEDVLQTVLTKVWQATWVPRPDGQGLRHFDTVAAVAAFGVAVARSTLRRQRESLAARLPIAPGVDTKEVAASVPDRPGSWSTGDLVPDRDLVAYIRLVEDPDQREVLRMIYEEGSTVRQVAERLACSVGKVSNLHHAALRMLRRRLAS